MGAEDRNGKLGHGDGRLQRRYCEATIGVKKTRTSYASSRDDGTINNSGANFNYY